MHRYKKYFLLIKSNPKLIQLFAKDIFRHGIKSSIRKAKRKANERSGDETQTIKHFDEVIDKFDQKLEYKDIVFHEAIDILIPVYNGIEFLEPLFKSIIQNTNPFYRLIIIDDCSPDKMVHDFLERFIDQNKALIEIIFIKNEKNLGFLQSVNRAAKEVKNHFVLLNTDTEVPPFWLERLMQPIIHLDKVATTTPMTNSGEICSFPTWLSDNKIYHDLDVSSVDKYFSYVSFEKNSIDVPTGVGFCMGINKDVFDQIGMFDEIFGKGYGEENDWCMRAIEIGYRNIIVPNLFVYHKHGGSFLSSEKKDLIKKNLITLNKKHPSYNRLIQDLIEKNPLKEMRDFLEILITFNTSKKNILIIDHELGGGTSIYRDNRINLHLKNKENVILYSYNFLLNTYKISFYLSENEAFFYVSSGFDDVKRINNFIKIDEIFLNSVVSFKSTYKILDQIIEFKKKTDAILVLPIHDFHCICPSYTLLNDKNIYCKIPKDLNICNQCLSKHKGDFKVFNSSNIDINKWREEWKKIMNAADIILCFSNSSAQIIQNVYAAKEKIKIVPHTVQNIQSIETIPVSDDEINIAVIGGINLAKGSLIIKKMIEIIENNKDNINIIIIGELALDLKSKHLKVHGKYQRNDLANLIVNYKINACLIPSIWPETFSYTTEEVMLMEMPLFVFDLGAPAERVRKYSKGHIIDSIDAQVTLNNIKKAFEKKN